MGRSSRGRYLDHYFHTDANWGQQDASTPFPGQTITPDECKSLLGHIVTRMDGPLVWDYMREPRSSRSVCQAEILSMDEGCKSTLMIRRVLFHLCMIEAFEHTPLFKNNREAVN